MSVTYFRRLPVLSMKEWSKYLAKQHALAPGAGGDVGKTGSHSVETAASDTMDSRSDGRDAARDNRPVLSPGVETPAFTEPKRKHRATAIGPGESGPPNSAERQRSRLRDALLQRAETTGLE